MPFEPGRSGNPAGGPVGSRHRQQLNGEFIAALLRDFRHGGPKAIERVRRTQPAAYLKILALLVPREHKVHVCRAKSGTPSVHPIRGDEIRALRKLRRENPTTHVFVTERGGPMSTIGFHHLIQRLGKAAKMPFPLHPHMLRHACGYKLANDGHDTRALQHYLGHKNIQHTVRYTELSPDRFRDFWRD
jgi:Phage integrase family